MDIRQIELDSTLEITFEHYVKGDKGDAFTYEDFTPEQLAALKGDTGDSAYDIAVQEGFVGTKEEWLASLRGEDGDSAYEIAVQEGFVGTKEEWLASLHGEDGQDGVSGGLLFPIMAFDPETGVLVIRGLEQEVNRIGYDEETAELIIRFAS